MNIEKKKLKELNPAVYNPRKNLKTNSPEYQKIKKSIQEFGYIDPIIVNKDGTIIGGHQRYKVLKELGYIEIDCVLVELDKEHEKALNVALNKISGDWDVDSLRDLLGELYHSDIDAELTGFGLDEIEKIMGLFGDEQSAYTEKIKIPNYVPTRDKPDLRELYDMKKTNELLQKIEKSKLKADVKDFLKLAAYRHIVFNYENIAEYYSHSENEIQQLMEESALVIIDYDKAIENGFIELLDSIFGGVEFGDDED